MKIEVKQVHIEQGREGNAFSCPIALALNDATGFKWIVGCHDCNRLEIREDIGLPKEAIKFIENFDSNLPVSPFEFELDYVN